MFAVHFVHRSLGEQWVRHYETPVGGGEATGGTYTTPADVLNVCTSFCAPLSEPFVSQIFQSIISVVTTL
jgi:hypothetical protein